MYDVRGFEPERRMASRLRQQIGSATEICERQGYHSPIITTPSQLKGYPDIGR